MISSFNKSTKDNRIIMSQKKCKVLITNQRKAKLETTTINNRELTEVMEEKVLGYTFNSKNSNTAHVEK